MVCSCIAYSNVDATPDYYYYYYYWLVDGDDYYVFVFRSIVCFSLYAAHGIYVYVGDDDCDDDGDY